MFHSTSDPLPALAVEVFFILFLLFWGVGGVFSQIISRHLEPERSGKVKATISFGKMAKKAAEIAVKT